MPNLESYLELGVPTSGVFLIRAAYNELFNEVNRFGPRPHKNFEPADSETPHVFVSKNSKKVYYNW